MGSDPLAPSEDDGRKFTQAETERYFAARAARAKTGQLREILARAGLGNPPREGDELDGPSEGESPEQA